MERRNECVIDNEMMNYNKIVVQAKQYINTVIKLELSLTINHGNNCAISLRLFDNLCSRKMRQIDIHK